MWHQTQRRGKKNDEITAQLRALNDRRLKAIKSNIALLNI